MFGKTRKRKQHRALTNHLVKEDDPRAQRAQPSLPNLNAPLSSASVLQLQGLIGNQATINLLDRKSSLMPNAPVIQREAEVSELNEIGRGRKFNTWISKVAELVDAGKCRLDVKNARDLNRDGHTIEVKVLVFDTASRRNRTFIDDNSFVVHYHPSASGASVNHHYASRMHLKSKINGQVRIYDTSIPDTIKAKIPTFREIRQQFGRRPANTGRGRRRY